MDILKAWKKITVQVGSKFLLASLTFPAIWGKVEARVIISYLSKLYVMCF